MNAAADELELEFVSSVGEFFAHLTHDDTTPIARIHSYEICEDGETLLVVLDLCDGSDCYATFCPGQPIGIHRTSPAPKPAPARHLFVVRCEPVA